MLFEPNELLRKYVHSVKDIYRHRYYVRNLPSTDLIVQSLAGYILDALEKGVRFRQFDCLKVMKAIVKDKHDTELSSETISLLFRLYRHYIFDSRGEFQWCATSLLRGRQLLDSEVSWIITNWQESAHLINRLLRYPVAHASIVQWAKARYKARDLEDRKSELIGLLILDSIPSLVGREKKETLIWAVYYSRAKDRDKARMLESLFSAQDAESFIKVCIRLRLVLACSPKSDPGVMRVFGPAAAWPPPGQEALDETDKTQPRTDHRQAA